MSIHAYAFLDSLRPSTDSLTYCLTCLLAYFLIDLLTYWLTDLLPAFLPDFLTVLLTELLTYWLIELLTDLLTYWLIYWLNDLLTYWLTHWLIDWLTYWLTYFDASIKDASLLYAYAKIASNSWCHIGLQFVCNWSKRYSTNTKCLRLTSRAYAFLD